MRALIVGHKGQDGKLLCKLLRMWGITVYGISKSGDFPNATEEHDSNRVANFEMFENLIDPAICSRILDSVQPDLLIHAAAIHANSKDMPSLEFKLKREITEVNFDLTQNLIRWQSRNSFCKSLFLNSSLIFGYQSGPMNSTSTLNPHGVYAESKAEAFDLIKVSQKKIPKISCAILFPHTSPYSSKTFLLQEIADQINLIRFGNSDSIKVENALAQIDISDARDTTSTLASFLKENSGAKNFVLGSGKPVRIQTIMERALAKMNISNFNITSRNPEPITTTFADIAEMEDKIPFRKISRDISQTLLEICESRPLEG